MYKKVIAIVMCVAVIMSVFINSLADNASPEPTIAAEDNPIITVDGKVLVKDKDYTLSYRDNVKTGTAAVIVHFIGNYSGEREISFNIIRKKSSSHSNGKENTTVKIMEDDNLIMTTETSGDVRVDLNQKIKTNCIYKAYVTLYGKPQINKEVEIIDDKGRTLKGRTDKNGIAYLSVVAIPTSSSAFGSKATPLPSVTHKPYIFGYEDGTFRPDNTLTRAETASMLNEVMDIKDNNKTLSFSDIASSAWYTSIVKKMASAGVINGYTDGTFRPENQITRAEFITMLMQNKSVQQFKKLSFSDVNEKLWSANYIYSAYIEGYIDGYADGTFKPDAPITRAEAVKVLNSVLKRIDFKTVKNPFKDVSEKHWGYKHILEASVEH